MLAQTESKKKETLTPRLWLYTKSCCRAVGTGIITVGGGAGGKTILTVFFDTVPFPADPPG